MANDGPTKNEWQLFHQIAHFKQKTHKPEAQFPAERFRCVHLTAPENASTIAGQTSFEGRQVLRVCIESSKFVKKF